MNSLNKSILLFLLFILICCKKEDGEMSITGLSTDKIKYGSVLIIYGKNFKSAPGAISVNINNDSLVYNLTPASVTNDKVEVEIYNHQDPLKLLEFSTFRVGIKTTDSTLWHNRTVSIVSSWKKVQDFPGNARYKSSIFSLDGNCYIGGGAGLGAVYKDLWKYNSTGDIWTRMTDLPGIARVYPRAFSNSTSGFLGAGYSSENSSKVQLYDFYKYDPKTDSWSSISDFPETILNFYVGFTITVSGRPFICLSNQVPSMKEFVNNSWASRPIITEMTECPASGVFAIGKKFYVVAGYRTNNSVSNSVWEYDTETGKWAKKSDFPGTARFAPAFFSIDKYGYYGCGMSTDLKQYKDMWRYDPSFDKWIRLEDFPGGIRSHLISSGSGKYGFAGLGLVQSPVTFFKDFWKYDPE